MKGIDSAGVVAGIFLSLLGGVLLVVSFFFPPLLIYAIPLTVIGLVILATLREQEHIEPIKEIGKNKKPEKRKRI